MRTSWRGVLRGVGLVAFLAVAGLPRAFADDPSSPPDPPGARIKPPTGVASQSRVRPPSGEPTTDARINTPGSAPQTDARVVIPIGATAPEPGFLELLVEWLRAQARIGRRSAEPGRAPAAPDGGSKLHPPRSGAPSFLLLGVGKSLRRVTPEVIAAMTKPAAQPTHQKPPASASSRTAATDLTLAPGLPPSPRSPARG